MRSYNRSIQGMHSVRARWSAIGIAVLVAALAAGCATPPPPATPEDPVGRIISENARSATDALRRLSEAEGAQRVVMTAKPPTAKPGAAEESARFLPAARDDIRHESKRPAELAHTPPTPVVGAALVSPAGLERPISVRWTGDIEELVQLIARETGWKWRPRQGVRVSPVVVSINATSRPAFDLLRDIGAIAGQSADVVVSETERSMTVRYPLR